MGNRSPGWLRVRRWRTLIRCRFPTGSRWQPRGVRRGFRSRAGRWAGRFRCSRRAAVPEFCASPARTGSNRLPFPVGGEHPRRALVSRDLRGPVHVVFLRLSEDRDRVLGLCDGMRARRLTHSFECETRLDRLDAELLPSCTRRVAGDELRRGSGVAGDAEEVGAGRSHMAISGRSSHAAASLASSRRRSTYSAFPRTRGSRSPPRSTTVSLGSTVAQFKI